MAMQKNAAAAALAECLLDYFGPAGRFMELDGQMLGVVVSANAIQVLLEDSGESMTLKCEGFREDTGDLAGTAELRKKGCSPQTVRTDMEFFWEAACPAIICCFLGGGD